MCLNHIKYSERQSELSVELLEACVKTHNLRVRQARLSLIDLFMVKCMHCRRSLAFCRLVQIKVVFLPRDAMHKRGLCRRAVSIRLSACLSRSWIMSKRINISSNIFHQRVATPF